MAKNNCIISRQSKGTAKFPLERAMTAHRGIRGIALLFPQPRCYMGVGGQRYSPAALPQGKKTWWSLYRRWGGPQVLSGRVWKISHLLGFDPPQIPARSELPYWLSYPGSSQYSQFLNISQLSPILNTILTEITRSLTTYVTIAGTELMFYVICLYYLHLLMVNG